MSHVDLDALEAWALQDLSLPADVVVPLITELRALRDENAELRSRNESLNKSLQDGVDATARHLDTLIEANDALKSMRSELDEAGARMTKLEAAIASATEARARVAELECGAEEIYEGRYEARRIGRDEARARVAVLEAGRWVKDDGTCHFCGRDRVDGVPHDEDCPLAECDVVKGGA